MPEAAGTVELSRIDSTTAVAAQRQGTAAAHLNRVLDTYRRGRHAAVVVTGPPGSGRTWLTRTVMGPLAAEGAVTEWIPATASAASIPFGALAAFLPATPPGRGSDRLAQFLALIAGLEQRARGGRLVLVIDDAHLLDVASAALVQHFAHQRRAFVVATVVAGHAGAEALLSLCKDGLAQRLDLSPLREDEVAAIAEGLLTGALDGPARRSLHEVTRGNGHLVRQVVEDEVQRGTLTSRDGLWSATRPFQVKFRAAALVDADLAGLAEAERRALECLALGGPLPFSFFEDLAGADVAHRLERSGFVTAYRRERRLEVRIDAMTAAALRADIPTAVGMSVRRELASGIEALGLRRRHDVLQVASWRLEADGGADPDLLVAAARTAVERGDHDAAERLARAALEADGGFAAAVQLGAALTCGRRYAEAASILGAWAHGLSRAPVGEAEAYVRWRVQALLWSSSPAAQDRAVAFLAEAHATRADTPFASMVRAMRAWVLAATGRDAEAAASGRTVLADPAATPSAIRLAEHVVTLGCAFGGRPATASPSGRAEHTVAPKAAEPTWPVLASLVLGGRLDDADALASVAYGSALTQGDGGAHGRSALIRGWTALMRGRVATATRWFVEAAVSLRRSDVEGNLPLCLALLALGQATLGDVDAARRARDEAAADGASGRYGGTIALADVRITAATGRTTEARRLALEAASQVDGRPLLRAALLHEALELGCLPSMVHPGLAEAATAADAEWPRLLADQAAAAARSDAEGLERVSAALEALGMMLLAAQASLMASAVHGDGGRRRRALRAAAQARRLLELCEGALAPSPRDGAPVAAASLTPREREVAGLAALGLTSAAIARELVVSVRTIESHLYNAYAKLGIDRRSDLPAALGTLTAHNGARAGQPPLAPRPSPSGPCRA